MPNVSLTQKQKMKNGFLALEEERDEEEDHRRMEGAPNIKGWVRQLLIESWLHHLLAYP